MLSREKMLKLEWHKQATVVRHDTSVTAELSRHRFAPPRKMTIYVYVHTAVKILTSYMTEKFI